MADQSPEFLARLASVAGKLVPGIAGLLFGPVGAGVAGGVVAAAKAVFGDDAAADPDALEAAIAADPSAALAFKSKLLDVQAAELERQHQERMAELRDKEGARGMYVATRSPIVSVMAVLTVLLFFVTNGLALYGVFYLLTEPINIDESDMPFALVAASTAGTILGWVNSKADLVWAFFFGASRGSDAKTDAMSGALADALKAAAGGRGGK